MRIEQHPILDFDRHNSFTFSYDGEPVTAYRGESIAAALHAAGVRVLSRSVTRDRPRGFFCGIGKCSSCLMRVDGIPSVRTCIVPAEQGMEVEPTRGRLPEVSFNAQPAIDIDVEVLVIGAGPAGMSAAIEAASHGSHVLLLDENPRMGGQLVKQTHKFFGSREEQAGTRGVTIARELERRIAELADDGRVDTLLQTTAFGYYDGGNGSHVIAAANRMDNQLYRVTARQVIIATGAQENMLAFPGNDLPGVYGAGGVQTLMNVYGVRPGERVLMVGAGNVGLIVSYQLLQAGVQVERVVEAMPRIGGYHVHAAKLRRHGVPIQVRHSIREVYGDEAVEGATIVDLDDDWNEIEGSTEDVPCDTVCLAVGLTPSARLLFQAGAAQRYIPAAGGHVALHNDRMETSIAGLYTAGDTSGIEEASTAMVEGKIAGLAAADTLHDVSDAEALLQDYHGRLADMRAGPFGEKSRQAKKTICEEADDAGI